MTYAPLPSIRCPVSCASFLVDWVYEDLAPGVDARQFGNIRASSTTHCLISFLDYLHTNLDKRKTSVICTFIDFKKAFDLVDHTIILSKAAASTDIRECLIPWLVNFSNRRQAVHIQGPVSSLEPLTCGLPQGTKMGHLCFLILINDALLDTIATTINNTHPDCTYHQHTLDNLLTWTTTNNVTINHQKSVNMKFDFSTTPNPASALSLGDSFLDLVHSTKLFGVTIDDELA